MAMVHHTDVAQGIYRAIRVPRPAGGGYRAYNIAGDGVSTVFELHELAGQSMDLAAAAVVALGLSAAANSTRLRC